MKVLAALSGGVDSSVAAALLVDAGHDVTGVHLALSRNPQSFRTGARGCCSKEDSHDAARVADVLGIPYYVWDFSDRFATDVIDTFVAEYTAGRTPNPCVVCNEKIKFAAVLERGRALGFDAVATGHYARLTTDDDGTVHLSRAADPAKDQSYVLGVLTQEQLRHSLFPLGDLEKSRVRTVAAARGLLTADKPDSHDICFIPDGDTAGFLARRLGEQPGDIIDTEGNVVGSHTGAYRFTVGQRRGLRLGVPTPDHTPRYVLDISPVDRTVTVGSREDLRVQALTGVRPTWTMTPRLHTWRGLVQVRAHATPVPADITAVDDTLQVQLQGDLSGVAPGQTMVCFDGDEVIGSAVIDSTERGTPCG